MATCERCWERARARAAETGEDQVEAYRELVSRSDCTPEQQAGREATRCPKCDTKTVHQHTKQCIACGWREGGA